MTAIATTPVGTTVRVTDGTLVRKTRKAAERHRDDCRSSVDADGTTTYWTGQRSVPATCTWDLVPHADGGWFVQSVLRVHLPIVGA